MNVEQLLATAQESMVKDDRDAAASAFVQAYRVAYGNGVAKGGLMSLAKRYFSDAIVVRDSGDIAGALKLSVRSLELNPDSDEVRALQRSLWDNWVSRDLTQQCLIFPDAARATQFYGDAIQTALDFVTFGGVVGDILEFGVLAGWTARLFAERMRKMQFYGDLYLFDSFHGLPRSKDPVDEQSYDVQRGIWAAEMELPPEFIAAVGKPIEEHIAEMLSYVISENRVHIKKGFYSETLKTPLRTKAAIVHLDCDLYQSTKEVFDALVRDDVLQDGTVLMFDDWNCNRANPAFGQRRALAEFLRENGARYSVSHYFNYGFNCAAFILHDLDLKPAVTAST